jgi:MscS family membrane protein
MGGNAQPPPTDTGMHFAKSAIVRRVSSASCCVATGVLLVAWLPALARSQAEAPAVPEKPQVQAARDPLGRDTPRGTVRGFLSAARKEETEIARQYLDTSVTGTEAEILIKELFVVLDTRLPARVSQISDAPEGSRANPLLPDQEIAGTIRSDGRNVEILLERVTPAGGAPIWLFSPATLASVPAVYEDLTLGWGRLLPRSLITNRLAGIRLFEWITVLLGLPVLYLLTMLLNRILTPVIRSLWRRFASPSELFARDGLPMPVRLLILAFAIRWFLTDLPLSLPVRQFWSNVASLLIVTGFVWLLILLNGEVERYIQRRYPPSNVPAAATLVRLLRRMVDLLVVFVGVLVILQHFGVNLTPALAGLGVGGIAVALAAQKTLENIVAGASLVFDHAVRVGDFLKMGDVQGTVEHIGLRSTRIRTLDRTVVTVPNGQIANVSLETMSARDKFWFHPIIGVRYDTLPHQLHAVVDGIRRLLDQHPLVDRPSIRVRFFRLAESSMDVDVYAYIFARDWNHFLEIQEQLLFGVTETVEAAGTGLAFPSLSIYSGDPTARPDELGTARVRGDA